MMWEKPSTRWNSVQFSCSVVFDTLRPRALQHTRLPICWSLLKLMSIESVMPSNHLILRCLLLPPSIFPSIRVFSSESVLHIRGPTYTGLGLGKGLECQPPGLGSCSGGHGRPWSRCDACRGNHPVSFPSALGTFCPHAGPAPPHVSPPWIQLHQCVLGRGACSC